ncbi:MAG: class I SAM-dependent methyltransferase [Rhodospirillales bacterium]
MTGQDSFYLDILKGLGVYFDSRFIDDIRKTAARYPEPALGYALNRNQVASKKWLADALFDVTDGKLGRVCVLGGWYGVLSAMLLHDPRFRIEAAESVDIDAGCAEIAESLNRTHVDSGAFTAVTADMYALDFEDAPFDLVVNTSCEHVTDIGGLLDRIPAGTLLVLQSNNYYGIEGHVNCVDDLESFKGQAPMADVMFEGGLELSNYTRFMIIGRK